MFRKLVIAAVAGLALLSPLVVSETQAAPRHARVRQTHHRSHHSHRHGHHSRYRLMVRQSGASTWRCVGAYGSRSAAWNAARGYRQSGCTTMIR